MTKILHTYRYTGIPWEILKSVVPSGYTIETLNEPTYDCLLNQVIDADYILVSGRIPIDEGVLSMAKRLKMIQRTGVGTDMLDKEAIKKRGIPVYVNAGINARSVAEHTIALIICCLKNIPLISTNVKKGIWEKQNTGVTCNELYGKNVGLVGLGAIGRRVATYLKVFGARVLYTDIVRMERTLESELNITYVSSLEELLPQVDILSLHCPLTPQNTKMINKSSISSMKRGAAIVNTARGKLIDEEALYEALLSKHLRAAALDVHYEEPIIFPSKLSTLDNVIMTPHIGGITYETFHSMMYEAIKNIDAFHHNHLDEIETKRLHL